MALVEIEIDVLVEKASQDYKVSRWVEKVMIAIEATATSVAGLLR